MPKIKDNGYYKLEKTLPQTWLDHIGEAVSGYVEDSIFSEEYSQEREDVFKAFDYITEAINNPKYKIIQAFTYGWHDVCADEDGKPLRFDTIDEAMRDIRDTIETTQEAFKRGDMSEAYSYDDYKIVPEWHPPHAEVDKDGCIV